MSDVDRIATRCIEAWNTTDETERRRAVTELYSRDARYVDPLGEATGHDEICGLIGAVQGRFPGFALRLLDGVDGHHDLLRFPVGARSAGCGGADRRLRHRGDGPGRKHHDGPRLPRPGAGAGRLTRGTRTPGCAPGNTVAVTGLEAA